MSRWGTVLGVAFVVAALAFAALGWMTGPRPGVTAENVRRIRSGMMLPEVGALLGREVASDFLERGDREAVLVWEGKRGTALVWVADGKVVRASFHPRGIGPQTRRRQLSGGPGPGRGPHCLGVRRKVPMAGKP